MGSLMPRTQFAQIPPLMPLMVRTKLAMPGSLPGLIELLPVQLVHQMAGDSVMAPISLLPELPDGKKPQLPPMMIPMMTQLPELKPSPSLLLPPLLLPPLNSEKPNEK